MQTKRALEPMLYLVHPYRESKQSQVIERAEWCDTWTKPPMYHHAPQQLSQDNSLVSTEEQQIPSLQMSGLETCTSLFQACGLTCMD